MVSNGDNHGVKDTAGVGSGESDVSSLSPSGGPGVLDDVVVSSVSDGEDGVVQSGLAI
jgi:hypothetical protein